VKVLDVNFNYVFTTILEEHILFNCSFSVLDNNENIECGMYLLLHTFPIKYSDISFYEIDRAANLISFLNTKEMKKTIYSLLSEEISTGLYQSLIKEEKAIQAYWMNIFKVNS